MQGSIQDLNLQKEQQEAVDELVCSLAHAE